MTSFYTSQSEKRTKSSTPPPPPFTFEMYPPVLPQWLDRTLYWVKCCVSLVLYLLSGILVFYGIVEGISGFFPAVPWYGQLIILLVFFFLLGILEGMQICIIALMKEDAAVYKSDFTNAWKTVKLGLRPNGLEKFLLGRQVLVLLLMFFLAR